MRPFLSVTSVQTLNAKSLLVIRLVSDPKWTKPESHLPEDQKYSIIL